MGASIAIGFDIGGTKSSVVVGTSEGEILGKRTFANDVARGPEMIIGDLIQKAVELRLEFPVVTAAGVSVGGPVDQINGIVYSPPNLPGWDSIPLRQRLENALGISVSLRHDAVACALSESRWGAGKGASRLAYLTCGTGFGVGLVMDGVAYLGAGGCSVELGHVRYADDGPLAYGKVGSFESYCAGASLPKLASWKFPGRWAEIAPDGPEISSLAIEGDQDATAVLMLNSKAVGDACALLSDLLGLDMIVLGSMALHLGSVWVDSVQERFWDQVLPSRRDCCRILPAALGSKLQDLSSLVPAFT